MNRFSSSKFLIAAALAFGAAGITSAAHAGTDVTFAIGVQAPYGYVAPAPVYVQPRTVYVQPQPVYVQPQPAYVQPQPVYYGGGHRRWERGSDPRDIWGDADHDGIPNVYDHDWRFYDSRAAHRAAMWGDPDHDGVPNRYDRAPRDPSRR
jgi:hypothetical protein